MNAGKGKRALAAELRTKGVDDEVIAAALADIDAGAERTRAEQLVRDKLRRERLRRRRRREDGAEDRRDAGPPRLRPVDGVRRSQSGAGRANGSDGGSNHPFLPPPFGCPLSWCAFGVVLVVDSDFETTDRNVFSCSVTVCGGGVVVMLAGVTAVVGACGVVCVAVDACRRGSVTDAGVMDAGIDAVNAPTAANGIAATLARKLSWKLTYCAAKPTRSRPASSSIFANVCSAWPRASSRVPLLTA